MTPSAPSQFARVHGMVPTSLGGAAKDDQVGGQLRIVDLQLPGGNTSLDHFLDRGYLLPLGLLGAVAGASRRKQDRCGIVEAETMPRYREAEEPAARQSHPLQAH